MSPVVLAELVVRVSSTRLKLVMADAIFRSLCCRNGFTVGDEPLSLKKMVCICLALIQSDETTCIKIANNKGIKCTIIPCSFVVKFSTLLLYYSKEE